MISIIDLNPSYSTWVNDSCESKTALNERVAGNKSFNIVK